MKLKLNKQQKNMSTKIKTGSFIIEAACFIYLKSEYTEVIECLFLSQ